VIQWQWPDYNPITTCSAAQLRCNGGRSATQFATAAPGDQVSAIWQQWTHAQGPVLVWMYKCPGAFSSCDGSGQGWFKIDESGFSGDGVTVFLDSENPSGWGIAKLMGGNKQWTSTIPQGLAPGNYLIRHELIALHQANAPQFYPECAQIQVTGNGNAQPDSSYKAAIPGYCNDGDSNIRVSSLGLPSCMNITTSANERVTKLGPHQQPPAPPDLQDPRTSRLQGHRLQEGS